MEMQAFRKFTSKTLIQILGMVVAMGSVTTLPVRSIAQSERNASDLPVVNGVTLKPSQVQALEQMYQVRIRKGHYWYDSVSGAWGMQGGPTRGFLMAHLNLGGSLRRNASNGRTGVFANGRELHRQDVQALEQLGPVQKGRYWVDEYGNFGFEGRPALGNLVALANARRPRREGILSTYDKVGLVVIGPGS